MTNPGPKMHGQPGGRAFARGLIRASLPFCFVLLLAGYAIGVLLPLPTTDAGAQFAVVAVAALAILAATFLTARRMDNFFKGARGEQSVAFTLARLPSDYEIFHGVDLRQRAIPLRGRSDFDHIVLGPFGIVAIETKNWHGPVHVADGAIQVEGFTPAIPPLKQAAAQAAALRKWIGAKLPDGAQVTPLLCFTGEALAADAPRSVDGVLLCREAEIVGAITALAASRPALPLEAHSRLSSLLASLAE